ncbi:MAG: hypothetical protein V1790_12235 [Planctomycetota bacterium]
MFRITQTTLLAGMLALGVVCTCLGYDFGWGDSAPFTISSPTGMGWGDSEPFIITLGGIPVVSEWGLLVMTLLVLTAGTIVIRRSKRERPIAT